MGPGPYTTPDHTMGSNPYIDFVIWVFKSVHELTLETIEHTKDGAHWLAQNVDLFEGSFEAALGFIILAFLAFIVLR